MIIRLLARRPLAFHTARRSVFATSTATPAPPLVRSKHTVPNLEQHDDLRQNGIPGLLSPKGFSTAYVQYMEHLTDELNAVTSGTPLENTNTKDLVIDLARNPVRAHDFNVASMLWNNHFFFNGINMNASVHSSPSSDVLDEINHSFSSLDTLRESFLTTAQAMFGPGFVWLVQVNEVSAGSVRNSFRILPTYLAGSPLSGAHYRRQSLDLNTENPDSYTSKGLNPVGAFGSAAQTVKKDKKALGGVDVIPLLCVNTWEHVWLHDYGIKGKRDYLERWWEAIHWNRVAEHATIAPKQRQNQFTYTSSI